MTSIENVLSSLNTPLIKLLIILFTKQNEIKYFQSNPFEYQCIAIPRETDLDIYTFLIFRQACNDASEHQIL